MFHFSKTYTSQANSSVPGFEQIMANNPELKRAYTEAAMREANGTSYSDPQPSFVAPDPGVNNGRGLGGLFGNISNMGMMGGGLGNMVNMFTGGLGNMMNPYQQQPQQPPPRMPSQQPNIPTPEQQQHRAQMDQMERESRRNQAQQQQQARQAQSVAQARERDIQQRMAQQQAQARAQAQAQSQQMQENRQRENSLPQQINNRPPNQPPKQVQQRFVKNPPSQQQGNPNEVLQVPITGRGGLNRNQRGGNQTINLQQPPSQIPTMVQKQEIEEPDDIDDLLGNITSNRIEDLGSDEGIPQRRTKRNKRN